MPNEKLYIMIKVDAKNDQKTYTKFILKLSLKLSLKLTLKIDLIYHYPFPFFNYKYFIKTGGYKSIKNYKF
jgi:hypothetical protein